MPTFVYNSLLYVYGFHGKMNIFTLICINYDSDGKLNIAIMITTNASIVLANHGSRY